MGSEAIQYFMDKFKLSMKLPPGLMSVANDSIENINEDLEHHEVRYRINLQFENFHAAKYHIVSAIELRTKKIIKKHCG